MADHWTENPDFPVTDWQYDVASGNTRLGYQDWCRQQPQCPDPVSAIHAHQAAHPRLYR